MTARPANGRPLRFFGLTLCIWIIGRIAMTGPSGDMPVKGEVARALSPRFRALPIPVAAPAFAYKLPAHDQRAPAPTMHPPRTLPPERDVAVNLLDFIRFTVAYSSRHYASDMESGTGSPILSFPPPPNYAAVPGQRPSATDRWRASAWMLWRPDRSGDATVASVGQLGASQAGARIDYDVAPAAAQRVAAYARISRALVSPAQPEAAIGLSIQPSRRLPVSLALERRIALGEGARNAMAAMVAGGFGPVPIGAGLIAEGYGQAGIVGFRAGDAFADGRVSVTKAVAGAPVAVGGAPSGGAQPGVHRVDIGPAVHVRLPIRPAAGRLMIEWRERIAGRANPRSGLALTLAADF